MLFTVVIPLYNKAPYIELTLDCLFNQSYADLEVIVVDDGSKDGGAELIEARYADPRLRVIRQANAGVSAARNRGIAEAAGQWVAFLDADDCWHPQYLACMKRLIDEHPQVDMVAAQLRFIPDSSTWSPLPWATYNPDQGAELITDLPGRWMQGIPFSTSAVCVRLARLRQMQPCFAHGESNGEDLDLWFRLGELTPIAWMPQELMAYRAAAAGSLSSQHKALTEPPYLARMEARARQGQLSPSASLAALKFVADQRVTLARTAHIRGEQKAAWQWLLRSGGHRYTRRWYVSLIMMALLPSSAMRRWESWRVARATRGQVIA